MRKRILKLTAVLLVVCMLLPLAACDQAQSGGSSGGINEPVSAEAVFNALLNGVAFDAALTDHSASAETSFAGMPEGVTIKMYSSNARYADELTWIALADASDKEAAMEIVDKHIEQKQAHYTNYQSDQLPKLENAIVWEDDTNIILCVTADTNHAEAIIKDPSMVTAKPTEPAPTETQPTEPDATEPAPTQPQPTETEPSEEDDTPLNADGYPAIISESETVRDIGTSCLVDNMAYEYYVYYTTPAQNYASLVSKVSKELEGQTNVYCLVIPTAIGVVFPDNLKEKYSNMLEDQGARLDQIYAMMDSSVIPVNCYENLMNHRDEYLYFRSDWHWTGLGAYYAYETFCQVKGITPYTLEERPLSVFEGYLGGLYWWCGEEAALKQTPDTVYAWHPYSENASMYFIDQNGSSLAWPIINDVSGRPAGEKYLTFAAADQPFAEFTNPDVTDGSVAIVVKESFGNVLMSYLVDHYSTVYEIDYRYWEGDLIEFARRVGADDIIFANNTGMVRSDYLIGFLDNIIP